MISTDEERGEEKKEGNLNSQKNRHSIVPGELEVGELIA
jgi:hypothetical protein